MNIDIQAEELTPRRQTYANVARRLGEDRPASRYDEATYDLQASVNFHYRPTWDPTHRIFDPTRTAVAMADWDSFADPRQFYYGAYNISRANMNAAADRAFDLVDDRGLIERIDADWLDMVKHYLIPLRHYEWGADLNSLLITDWGYGARVTSAAMFAAADRLGMAQLITRIGITLGGGTDDVLNEAKAAWIDADDWQGIRRYVEDSFVIKDWFETFVAQYVVADNVLLPLAYRNFDDAGLTHNGIAISMMCEFMVDWMKDNARWVDALVKVAAAESDANATLISGWYRAYRDQMTTAVAPLATSVLGDTDATAAIQATIEALDERVTKLGLSA